MKEGVKEETQKSAPAKDVDEYISLAPKTRVKNK